MYLHNTKLVCCIKYCSYFVLGIKKKKDKLKSRNNHTELPRNQTGMHLKPLRTPYQLPGFLVLQVKYRKDFEQSKGRGLKFVLDTPELQRLRKAQDQISNVCWEMQKNSCSQM